MVTRIYYMYNMYNVHRIFFVFGVQKPPNNMRLRLLLRDIVIRFKSIVL
jgi:hypothetical protein